MSTGVSPIWLVLGTSPIENATRRGVCSPTPVLGNSFPIRHVTVPSFSLKVTCSTDGLTVPNHRTYGGSVAVTLASRIRLVVFEISHKIP